MIDEAEEDFAQQERIHIRWSRPQLEVVRRAAQAHGMSLGTYVKMAAFRQAVQDLKDQSILAGVAPVAAGRPVMVLIGVGQALQPQEGAEYYRVIRETGTSPEPARER